MRALQGTCGVCAAGLRGSSTSASLGAGGYPGPGAHSHPNSDGNRAAFIDSSPERYADACTYADARTDANAGAHHARLLA